MADRLTEPSPDLCFGHDHADCPRNRRAMGSVDRVRDEHLLVILNAEAFVLAEFYRWLNFEL